MSGFLEMKNKKPFCTREDIRRRFKASGWSVRELARRSGVSLGTVAGFVAGRADTTTEKADAMRAVLEEKQ